MQFILIAYDKAGGLPLRLATRPSHLEYFEKEVGSNLLYGGPMLDEDGNPKGSVMLVEAADEAAAKALFAADPYALVGLFAQVNVTRFRTVFRDGLLVKA